MTKTKKDGSQFKVNGKTHYERNKEYYLERNRRKRAEKREYILNIKKSKKCVDCGISDYRVLDFDHVRDDKLVHIGDLPSRNWSYERIDKELDKCEVRCANCHRIVTYERRDASV